MIKVLELFAGIGACSKALENLGIEHEIVDAVEIDKFAIKAFNLIHHTNFEPQDIREWDKDIQVDLIIHGSPCQDFSIAGKQAGGDEGSGTRSSLMYETLRIVEKLQPKYVIWENVKNILSRRHVHNWDKYAERMEELGYTNYCQILNAKDYGIPLIGEITGGGGCAVLENCSMEGVYYRTSSFLHFTNTQYESIDSGVEVDYNTAYVDGVFSFENMFDLDLISEIMNSHYSK